MKLHDVLFYFMGRTSLPSSRRSLEKQSVKFIYDTWLSRLLGSEKGSSINGLGCGCWWLL